MSELTPENDGLSDSERSQADQVAGVASNPARTMTMIGVGLAAAFLVYREYAKRKLNEQLDALASSEMDEEQLYVRTMGTLNTFMPTWLRMVSPLLVSAYALTIDRERWTMSNDFMMEMAERYAVSLGDHLNGVTAESLAKGYAAQVNQGIATRAALSNVIGAVGVPLRQMMSLVQVWKTKEQPKNNTDRVMPKVNKQRAEQIIAAAIDQRAKQVGEQESWNAKEQTKTILWVYAQRNGMISETSTREWITAEDELVCPSCGPLHRAQVLVGEPFVVPGKGKVWSPPLHLNCLPGDTRVSAQGVSGVSQRVYEGEIVTVRTVGGRELSGTPNHPVLTDKGWFPLHLLAAGDHVVCALDSEGSLGGADQGDDVPPRIEEVASAFRERSGVTSCEVPTSSPDFHGDGTDGEVAQVWSDGALSEVTDPAFIEDLSEDVLQRAGVTEDSIAARHALDLLVKGKGDPSNGSVSRGDLIRSLLTAHPSPLHSLGLGSTSPFDSVLGEYATYDVPGDGESFSQRLLGLTGTVALDEIVEVRTDPWSGHVYNLQTVDGWYIGNGIVTHNCRCTVKLHANVLRNVAGEARRARRTFGVVRRFNQIDHEVASSVVAKADPLWNENDVKRDAGGRFARVAAPKAKKNAFGVATAYAERDAVDDLFDAAPDDAALLFATKPTEIKVVKPQQREKEMAPEPTETRSRYQFDESPRFGESRFSESSTRFSQETRFKTPEASSQDRFQTPSASLSVETTREFTPGQVSFKDGLTAKLKNVDRAEISRTSDYQFSETRQQAVQAKAKTRSTEGFVRTEKPMYGIVEPHDVADGDKRDLSDMYVTSSVEELHTRLSEVQHEIDYDYADAVLSTQAVEMGQVNLDGVIGEAQVDARALMEAINWERHRQLSGHAEDYEVPIGVYALVNYESGEHVSPDQIDLVDDLDYEWDVVSEVFVPISMVSRLFDLDEHVELNTPKLVQLDVVPDNMVDIDPIFGEATASVTGRYLTDVESILDIDGRSYTLYKLEPDFDGDVD